MNWIVAQTETRYEYAVERRLKPGLYETYVPRIRVNGRISVLFPGYIFIGFRGVLYWYPLLRLPHIVRLLMAGEQPAQLQDDVVNQIKKREVAGFVKLPLVSRALKRGQKVRIIRGSFEGQIGIYEGMSGADRVRMLLELLGQTVPVELPGKDIAPLNVARESRIRY